MKDSKVVWRNIEKRLITAYVRNLHIYRGWDEQKKRGRTNPDHEPKQHGFYLCSALPCQQNHSDWSGKKEYHVQSFDHIFPPPVLDAKEHITVQQIKQLAGLILVGIAALLLAHAFWLWISYDEYLSPALLFQFGGIFEALSKKGLMQAVHFGHVVTQSVIGVALFKWGYSLFQRRPPKP